MANIGGLFELKSVSDLVEKARHDLARLRANPSDTYAAFDFFVTARHVPDWLFPQERAKRDALFAQFVELRICRHLADGGKHFELTHPQHKQVASTAKTAGVWGDVWAPGTWAPGVWGDGLFINLDPRDQDTISLGTRVSALQLAERVMTIVESAV
jgi:hypothetical protein